MNAPANNIYDSNTTTSDGRKKPPMSRILIIDDEPGYRALLSQELGKIGYQVMTATNGEEGLEKIRQGKFELAISDIKMPKMDGIEFLETVKKEHPDIEVIMGTGFGTVEMAVSAMKKGAYDFIQKPFNLPEVVALVEKALEKRELRTIIGVYEASKAISSSINLNTLLPIIMRFTLQILKADDASFMLRNDDGSIQVVASIGLENDQRKDACLALGERVAGQAEGWNEPVHITGALESDPRFTGIPHLRDIESSLVCPLKTENKFIGVLNVNRTNKEKDPFTSSDLRCAAIFGSQIAQAVTNAKLYQDLDKKIGEIQKAYVQLEKIQSQLVQSEKLAAIGQLAAGVAHELNNPLTGIMGFSQMVLEGDGLSKQQREDVESIFTQSKRCRDIILNLLQFSKRREFKKEPIQIAPLLETTLQLVKYEFSSSGIDMSTEFQENLSPVWGDPSQLQQVFLNLITNAKHALEKKEPARLTIQLRQTSDKVILSFKDTGCGIPKENLGKIFDPFFTTKPVGKGTGLGLSISYGIIQEHQGTLRVESQEGEGSTFVIELPLYHPNDNESKNDSSC